MIRRLWHGDPALMRHVHAALTALWCVMIPVSFATGLTESVPYVVLLSEIALVLGSWSAYQSARSAGDVVDAMVADDRIPTEGTA